MTTRLAAVTPLIEAAPGDVVNGRVRIENDAPVRATFSIRVVGLTQPAPADPRLGPSDANFHVVIEAASEAICDVPITVPLSLGTGQHAAAFEVSSDRPGDRSALSPFTLSIASVERVAITPRPSTIRARRRSKFDLELVNHEPAPVEFSLQGGAPDVSVRFKHDTFRLVPGQQAHTRAKITGPRRWAGETTQHNVQIVARGRAAATSVTLPYIQRPLFAQKLRTVLAAVCVLALALASLGGVLLWSQNRASDDDATATAAAFAVDADGDGLLDPLLDENGDPIPGTGGQPADNGSGQDLDGDGFFDPLLDIDGNPIPGTGGAPVTGGAGVDTGSGEDLDGDGLFDPALDADGNPIPGTGGAPVGNGAGGGTGGDDTGGEEVGARYTVVGGTISAEGSNGIEDITIRTTPIQLGAPTGPQIRAFGFRSANTAADIDHDAVDTAHDGAASDGASDDEPSAKIWSARLGASKVEQTTLRQSEPLEPRTKSPDSDGVWFFTDVLIGRSHEFVFSKPGYDTQSFVLTPPEDGSPVELDVELIPASGRLSGAITRAGGAELGGVQIEVSDGTLVFETTSATDTDVGAWNLDGVSTPGTYTITASLAGFGTEVIQVRLGEGETNDDVDVVMTPGVGSIGGALVDENSTPLGGVTLTATNGKITRTTTSQTDGNIGSYNIPQLDINPPTEVPETYTITAERAGYVTQTRRVPLGGSLSNANFVMVRTTQNLGGTVTSAATNRGILDAGVTLTKDDLMFRTTTNGSGSFGVTDLPPGNYVVTVEHFEHLPVTEFVTIEAGVAPPALNVTLQVDTGDADIGTGTLVVTVVDENAETTELREITDATIFLTRTITGETETFESNGTFTYTIPNLTLGTYTLVVKARGFNDSPARQVSIGRSTEEVLIPMQKLGSAQGSVIDALTGELLTSYSVTLTRILENGEEQPRAPLPSSGTGWATAPNALETGTWSATIQDEFAPPGYTVLNDQIFDPTAGGPMRFIIPNDALDQIIVPPIEAVPYPNILGRIFKPALVGGSTVFLPLDDDSLTVEMRCGTNSYTGAVLTDELPAGGGGGVDTFFIGKQFTDGSKLIGDCELIVNADSFDTKIVAVPNVTISDGVLNTDRVVNIALNEPVGDFGGRVFWVDQRTGVAEREVPLVGIDVRANATVDFRSSDTGLPQDDTSPVPIVRTISTATSTGGVWAFNDKIPIEDYVDLNQQIFNTTTYDFDATGFGDSSIDVRVDENGRTITGTSGMNLDQTGGQAALAAELTPPDLRQISGDVTILTTDVAGRDYTAVGIDVTGPVAPPTGVTWPLVGPTATSGAFSVPDAPPGTWTTAFTAPDNHVFRAPTQVQARLEPGTDQAGFDTTLVELGLINVRLSEIDRDGTVLRPITTGATVRLFSETNGYAAPAPAVFGPGSGTGTDANEYVQTQLPVHATDPLRSPVTFRVEVEVPGYDTRSAYINGVFSGASQNNERFVRAGSRPMLAGTKTVLDIGLAKYGSITGEAYGITSPGILAPLDIPASGEPVVTATQVLDINGIPVADPATAQIIGPIAGRFSVSGPPGYYSIQVAHPSYLPPLVQPSGTTRTPPIFNPPVQLPGLFVMENDAVNAINSAFELPIRTSSLDITALRDLTEPASVVTNAWYFLESATVGTISGSLGPTGQLLIDGLLPGAYTLSVRSYPDCVVVNPGDCVVTPANQLVNQNAFPTIIPITIGESTATDQSIRRVRVPLPSLDGTIVGTVRAENQNNDPVPIPLPVQVTGDFQEPDAEVDGDPVANSPADPLENLVLDATAPAAEPSYLYTFSTIPTGVHSIVVPDIAGFTTPVPNARTVTVSGPGITTGPEFVYTADTTDVSFRLTPESPGHAYPNLAVTLTAPSGAVYDNFTLVDNVVSIPAVRPEIGVFSLFLDDDLHSQPAVPVEVPVDVEGDGTPLADFVAIGDKTRVNGLVQQNAGGGAIGGLGATGVITFVPVDPAGTAFQVPHSAGVYEIDVDPGRVDIQATNLGQPNDSSDDYEPSARIGLVPGPLVPGTIAVQPTLVINKLASLNVTITNADAVANGQPLLVDVNDTSKQYQPASSTAFRFDVPAGTYRVEFSGTDYPRLEVSASNTQLSIGQSTSSGAITLPRQLRVVVTGAATATVRVRPAGGNSSTQIAQQHGTGQDYLFISRPAVDAPIGFTGGLPATGDLDVIVASGGAATVRLDGVPFALGTALTVPLIQNPIVTVSGELTFPGGTAITSLPTGTAITATAPAQGDDPAASIDGVLTTDSSGTTYEIAGLSTTSDGAQRLWTISIDQPGLGEGSNTITLRSTSVPNSTKNITVSPNDVKVTFTVTSSGGDPVTGSAVTVAGSTSGALASGSTIEVLVPENSLGTALDWTVSGAADHLDATGSLDAFTTRADVAVAAALTSTRIKGTVSDADGPFVGATVKLCPIGAAAGNCTAPVATATSTTGGAFSFAGQPAGTYPLFAVTAGGTQAGSSTITVASNGAPAGAATVVMSSRTIRGVVSNADGTVVGATVKLCPIGSGIGDCTTPVATTTTVTDGVFTISGQSQGQYPIYVVTPGATEAGASSITINADGVPVGQVAVTLSSTAITGTVTGPSGAVVGATVNVCPIGSPVGPCGTPVATATTVAGGSFTVTGQTPGTYPIFVSTGGNALAGSSSITVDDIGIPNGSVSVTLQSTTITGTMSNSGGAVVGATVKLCPIGSPAGDCASPVATGTSVAGGAISFGPRPPGTYPVFATKSTTTGTAPNEVTVTQSGTSSVLVDANGVPTSTISLTIVTVP